MKNRITPVLALVALLLTLTVASPGASAAPPLPEAGDPCPNAELLNGTCVVDYGPPVCPDGASAELIDAVASCVSIDDPIITFLCPADALSGPDGCYTLVPKGPHGPLMCDIGILAGQNCVLVGPPPTVTRAGSFCQPGFGLIDGQCLRYFPSTNSPSQCPSGSVEDSIGDCRVDVAGGNKHATCVAPAELTAAGCRLAYPATKCVFGDFSGTRCSTRVAGPYCGGKLVTINMELGQNGNAVSGDHTVLGTSGNDVIWGTPGNDNIFGQGGHDTVCAGDGDDVILGNHGDDLLFGQEGNDTMYAGQGDDQVSGGSGNDFVDGFHGTDVCDGGPGNDTASKYCEQSFNVS